MFWGHSGTDYVSLTNDHTFCSVSDKLNRGKKKNASLSFRYLDLKNGISIIFLISMKILIKLQKIQKTWSLVQIEVNFAHLYYTNVSFRKFPSIKLLSKKMKRSYLLYVLYTVYATLSKKKKAREVWFAYLFTYNIEAFIMKTLVSL